MNQTAFRGGAAAALAIALAACSPGTSKEAAAGNAAFASAADALSARLQSGEVPPASDPAVRGFEAEAGKAMGTLGTAALPIDGFASYEALCGKAGNISVAYLNAGTANLAPGEKAKAMEANATRYMDRLFTPLLFSAHCTAAHLPFIEQTAGSDVAAKKDALEQVRGGAFAQVNGLLQMAGAGDIDAGHRRRIVDTLAGDAAKFAIVLSTAQRQSLAETADAVAATLPAEARPQAERIKAGLNSNPCNALCKM